MNELRDILHDSVTRLFDDGVTREVLTQAETGTWPAELWDALEENGLTRPLTPESQGGVGALWADAFVILRAAGRSGAPVPLAETIAAAWLADRAGLDVPAGPLTVASAAQAPSLSLEQRDGGWCLSGVMTAVPWGRHARHVVTVIHRDGAAHLAMARPEDADISDDMNIAREPRDTLIFDAAPVEAVALSGQDTAGDIVRCYGAMARSAQMAGGIERALAESVQYAKDRIQFGRPIAKFQAIQHQLAMVAAQSAQATIAAETAFAAADRGHPAFEVACAKIVAGDAAGTATAVAHQVHAAIGFTYEHALQFTTRRLWSWRAEYGAEADWAERLGRDAAARGAAEFWPDMTARQAGDPAGP